MNQTKSSGKYHVLQALLPRSVQDWVKYRLGLLRSNREGVDTSEWPLEPVVIIQPSQGWDTLAIRELWSYRDLIWILIWRQIKGKYRQMALGPIWIVLIPLVNMVIFSVIFGRLAKLPSDGVPYPIFIYSALLPWTYFSNAVSDSVSSLLKSMNLISKVYFPRMIVPLSTVLSGLVDLLISFLVLLGMMAYYGFVPSMAVLLLPLYVLLAVATALMVGLWNTNLAVKFRDLQFATTYGLRIWMYATPVVYSASLIPDRWQLVYQLNPMYWVVEGFRWTLLGTGQKPQPLMFVSAGFVMLLLILGAFVFQRNSRTIVDIL